MVALPFSRITIFTVLDPRLTSAERPESLGLQSFSGVTSRYVVRPRGPWGQTEFQVKLETRSDPAETEEQWSQPGTCLQPHMLGGILLPAADRSPVVATVGEGEPATAPGPRARQANGGGAVRLVEEHGAAVVGEPAVPALAGRGLRPNSRRLDPDPARHQLVVSGVRVCSRLGRVALGLVAIALEAPFEPVPLLPFPARGWTAGPLLHACTQPVGRISQSCIGRSMLAAHSDRRYPAPCFGGLNQPRSPLRVGPMSNDTNTFTDEERAKYEQELVGFSDEAKRYVGVNRGWDIAFKVLLLIIAILAIIGAAVAATYEKEPLPSSLKILNVATTGLTTLLGGFAFSQFNFANRQAVWQKKQNMFITLRHQLLFTNPDKHVFITQVETVRNMPETNSTELGPPKQPNSGG